MSLKTPAPGKQMIYNLQNFGRHRVVIFTPELPPLGQS